MIIREKSNITLITLHIIIKKNLKEDCLFCETVPGIDNLWSKKLTAHPFLYRVDDKSVQQNCRSQGEPKAEKEAENINIGELQGIDQFERNIMNHRIVDQVDGKSMFCHECQKTLDPFIANDKSIFQKYIPGHDKNQVEGRPVHGKEEMLWKEVI